MGRDPLVALDQLVTLATVEPALAREGLEAVPLRVVSEHIRVQVHAREPRVSAMSSPEFATLTTDDLVTGEAVALDLPPATVGARMASGLIDVAALVVLATGVLFLALVATANADGALQHVALRLVADRRLPGVPDHDGDADPRQVVGQGRASASGWCATTAGTVAVQQSFVRALIGIVEIYVFLGGPAFFCCLVSSHGKRIGDYAAGTYVVRDRFRLALPPPPSMPPVLARWAASADLATPPVGLTLAVRQYLGRLPTLDLASRDRLGAMLATRMAEYVAPPPPPGTTSWDFLRAVSAARRERDLARLHRDETLRARLTTPQALRRWSSPREAEIAQSRPDARLLDHRRPRTGLSERGRRSPRLTAVFSPFIDADCPRPAARRGRRRSALPHGTARSAPRQRRSRRDAAPERFTAGVLRAVIREAGLPRNVQRLGCSGGSTEVFPPTRCRRWWTDVSVAAEPGEAGEPREDRHVEHHEQSEQQHRRPSRAVATMPRIRPMVASVRPPSRPPAALDLGHHPVAHDPRERADHLADHQRDDAENQHRGRLRVDRRRRRVARLPGLLRPRRLLAGWRLLAGLLRPGLLSGLLRPGCGFRRRLVRHGRSLSAHGHARV